MSSSNTLLLRNGRVFQSKSEGAAKTATFHSCLLVKGDTIEHVGSEEDEPIQAALSQASGGDGGGGGSVQTLDLQGSTVLPGFIDGHIHLLMLGQALQKVDLVRCTSWEDIRDTITSYARANPAAERILCRNWMNSMTPDGVDAAMLDSIDPRPIFIDAKDLHSVWCSTSALAELGVDETTPDPAGGRIVREAGGSNKPTGLLSESATFNIVWPHVARIATPAERADAIASAIAGHSAAGYTGVIDMAMDEEAWTALQTLQQQQSKQQRLLPVRIAAYWLIRPSSNEAETLAQVDRAIELYREQQQRDTTESQTPPPICRIVGIKCICDGIVDACTAFLTEPYLTGAPSAEPAWSAAQLDPVVRRADAAGLQVALHAIGNAAITVAVDVLTARATAALRPRIEHLELASAADAARLGRAGIVASIQPVHADPAILRAWPALLGPERCARAFAYRDFADGGAVLALGSDAPTAPHAPLPNVYVAATRRSAREPSASTAAATAAAPLEPVNPGFALSVCEAVVAATEGAAYSVFADGWCGSLERGKKADFVVVDMQWDADALLQSVVKETWFAGEKVYSARG